MRISDWSSDVCSSDLIDGLLLTGSPSNVEPERYGEGDAADAAGPYDPDRDTMTANLVAACLALGKPVFGICRGLQELNVTFGGQRRRDEGRSEGLDRTRVVKGKRGSVMGE